MIKRIVKKSLLAFFIVLFLFISASTITEKNLLAIDYNLSNSWSGYDLDFNPQSSIIYDSDYRYFSEIIESTASIDVDKIYVIETAYDLYMLSVLSMGVDRTLYLSLDYVLGNDIDYYQTVQQNVEQRFIPIGFNEPFTGSFDGQGFEITNLYFITIMTEEEYQNEYSGLRFFSMFSKVSSSGIIKNLGLINPIIIQPIEWGIMTYVSPLIGENYGTVDHVYLVDTRGEASGLNAEGGFHLSGLISINYGTFNNSFVASKHIKSNAVIDNETTNVLLYSNLGSISNLYYDSTLYADVDALTNYVTGLETLAFQNSVIFDAGWFYNTDYQGLATTEAEVIQYTLKNTYPILQGLSISNNKLVISDASDLLYMNELLKKSGMFRLSDYSVNSDIDMLSVSSDAYVAANVGFNGSFSSSLSTLESRLYTRSIEQGGDLNYHTILNLQINLSTSIGNFASYALFSSLFGTVENINFANMEVSTNDLDNLIEKTKVLVGTIAGQSNSGSIINTHVDAAIDVLSTSLATTKLYVGGIVGEGSNSFLRVSSHGSINHDVQIYDLKNNESATGGIIGLATRVSMNSIYASSDITGMSYDASNDSTLYLGGVIGVGTLDSLNQIVQTGEITSHNDQGFIDELYISGMIGLLTNQFGEIHQLSQRGGIDVRLTNPIQLYLSGVMNIDGLDAVEDTSFSLYSISNHGALSLTHPLGHSFSDIELPLNEIHIAGTLITKNLEASMYGLFNYSDLSFDFSLIKDIASVLLAIDTTSITVFQSYNTGDITLNSLANLTQEIVKVSGNVLGDNMTLDEQRNEGDISITLNHDTLISSGNLYVNGLFDEISQDHQARHGFNGGNISIEETNTAVINYNVYLSGIGYHNANSNYYSTNDISHDTIDDLTSMFGSVDHMLNEGDLSITGFFTKDIAISGILMVNESLLTSSINLGDITNHIDTSVTSQKIESSGLVYLMSGAYAQIINGTNNGQIEALATNSFGYAHASGIALRNDLNIDGTWINSASQNQYAKIWFSINYGDIYAYSPIDETTYNISNETHSKAAGIFGIGLLSVMDAINYGNVYSKYLAGGIIGSLDFTRFGTYAQSQVFMANTINYGKIRAISTYNGAYQIDMQSMPARTIYNAFGSTIAKIHTSTLTWEFLSFSSTDIYPIDYITFGYMLNFDASINMVGNAPEVTLEASIATNGIGNTTLMAIVAKFMTTNPNDDSKAPFNLFFIEVSPKGSFYGKHITSFSMDAEVNGIFNDDFLFRNLPISYSGTNQYLKNYFSYVTADKANDSLITKLELNQTGTYLGLYILSSSSGINNGIYLPDQFDLNSLSPHYMDTEVNLDWLGSIEDPQSAIYKITYQMRQIKRSFATALYDLEIKQVDEFGDPITDGLALNKPIIDESRGLITYYLPSNATILNSTSVQYLSTYSYVEASEGLGRKVPNIYENGQWIYKWVGNYKKAGYEYLPIGPYNTMGTKNVTFNTSISNAKAAQNSDLIYNTTYSMLDLTGQGAIINSVYVHLPHVKQVINNNYWWDSVGLLVNTVSTVAAGYGPYKLISYQSPPTYVNGVYQYAGANEELVTYERTSPSINPVFNDAGIYFDVNFDSTTYSVAQGASLVNNEVSIHELASVPQSYGVYDVLIDASTDAYIDSVTDHYGSIRVFSEDYEESNAQTYRDYDIRIIRTADQSLTGISELLVNGIDALLGYTDFHSIVSSEALNYEKTDNLGVLSVTYQTSNIANEVSILPWITLYNDDTGDPIDSSLFVLSKGQISNSNIFNNVDGTFGSGTVTFDLEVTDYLPSGSYRVELELLTGEMVIIYVDKIQSSNAQILEIGFNNEDIALSGDSYTSSIPYGIFYDISDTTTHIVDFTNLDSIQNIYFTDLIDTNIPSYLSQLSISPFSTLISIDLYFSMQDTYRHLYQIEYTVQAEDSTINVFNHYLLEDTLTDQAIHIYKNGGELDLLDPSVIVPYLEAPTVRVEFNIGHVYLSDESSLVIESAFTPLEPLDEAVINVDYFIRTLPQIGYEIDFNQEIAIGTYQIDLSFSRTKLLWGQTLNWAFDFETIMIDKIKNDDSHLKNVMFVSDTIYSGFDTIVDYQLITELTYLDYLQTPSLRPMTVLPTSGIYYGDYSNYQTYWVIGQVQKTNLSYYLPTFELPDGAQIRRVIDFVNIDMSYQSEVLVSDFSPLGDGFSFNQYRVYAHDFAENPTHYTDYYIAVQDMTNNIRFNLEVINNSSLQIEQVFVEINVCQLGESYVGLCSYENTLLSMTGLSIYNPYLNLYTNNKFQTSAYGTYQLIIHLPEQVSYQITLQNASVEGSSFYLENSLLPRKYYVIVTIIDEVVISPWGYQVSKEVLDSPEINQLITYQSGEYFKYENVIYKVQAGYTYTYDLLNLPGSSPALGLIDVSFVYSESSTYLDGDYVYYLGSYYEALLNNNSGILPDASGIALGYWVLLS